MAQRCLSPGNRLQAGTSYKCPADTEEVKGESNPGEAGFWGLMVVSLTAGALPGPIGASISLLTLEAPWGRDCPSLCYMCWLVCLCVCVCVLPVDFPSSAQVAGSADLSSTTQCGYVLEAGMI